MKKRWWVLMAVALWIGSRPGGIEMLFSVALVVGIFWFVKLIFDHIERRREEVLDDFADRLARANARRMKEKKEP